MRGNQAAGSAEFVKICSVCFHALQGVARVGCNCRRKSGPREGENTRTVSENREDQVMKDAQAARPVGIARIATVLVIVWGGAFGAVLNARAQAPIVYSSATSRATAEQQSADGLVSRASQLPAPSTVPGRANDAPRSTPLPSINGAAGQPAAPAADSSAPIDIRLGQFSASYSGPTPVLPRPAVAAPSLAPAAPRAARPSPMAFATPYAGAPYQVEGRWYVPTHEPTYDEVGIASWYGPTFHGKPSATGETYDQMAMTAAHPTLPIPSLVRVTNLENGKSVIVRLNDRGPFVDDRLIDMSRGAAEALDMTRRGTARVRVQYVGPAPAAANATLTEAQLAAMPQAAPVQQPQPQLARPAPEYRVALEAPSPAPQATAAPRAQNVPGFYLQAGAFVDLANAYALRDTLRSQGNVSIAEAQSNGASVYRVMLGPWTSRADAEQAQARMAQAGRQTLIIAR
jgi:rare lipoprotein A